MNLLNLKNTLQTSLVIRLTFLFLLTTIIIWLLSVFTAAYISMVQKRQHIIEDLSTLSGINIVLSNQRFEEAERDAKNLMYQCSLATVIHHNDTSPGISRHLSGGPTNCTPTLNGDKYRLFLQSCDIADKSFRHDSFILNRTNEMSLLPTDNPSDYSTLQLITRRDFPLYPTHTGFYWSEPEYINGKGWNVSVAVADQQGVFFGVMVKLHDLITNRHLQLDDSIHVWLDQNNHLLPFSYIPQKIRTRLENVTLHDGWQQIPGFLILRTTLHGPGWSLVTLYPYGNLFSLILKTILQQIPFTLTALVLMTSTFCWLLHRSLAKPLWRFVDVINKTATEPLSTRLPEQRLDELGSIACAFNQLLDTLQVQYDNLENKVAERTQALNEAKKCAEQANKRKSIHLTVISHELRTPMNGVLGAIELLQTTPLNIKQQGLVDTARHCTLSLLAIINNLLDFSRIESGHFTLHIEETALLPLLDQTMQTILGPAQSKKLSLRTFVGQHVPLYFHTDSIRLRQILVNLLGNAVKFTETGGIRLTVKRHGEQLIFLVSDSGKGIEIHQQSQIFTAFYQVDTNSQGTGIGLTIVTSLTKMMGGKLKLNSVPGVGTCVSLVLPLKEYQPPHPIKQTLSAPFCLHRQLACWGIRGEPPHQQNALFNEELLYLPGKLYDLAQQLILCTPNTPGINHLLPPWQLQILLVDDADINRDIIGKMLVSLGQHVTIAASSNEALTLSQQQRFDLVLMDIRMPEIDGIECVQLWHDNPNNLDPDCMIVALSASVASEDIHRCKKNGIHHYITKPVTLATLARYIGIASEYQLLRNIELQEQEPSRCSALLATDDIVFNNKIFQSLDLLLADIESAVSGGKKIDQLIHTLKGCLGQTGQTELVCYVVDIENRIKMGKIITLEELTNLRQKVRMIFKNYTIT
ncbi:two component system sensor kinase [Salmonella enterica subsp. indica]|uniref:two component system sensor kinase n=1 Tax=Salmonella enterica TaxID=28901 RepID=UPI0009B059E9|nr:two component system sensor kinase [Salmonella enterica]EAW1721227.1 two component system sensor kinase [Salmonella enterica subsp. indica]EBP3211676.1 two component system sensor kinase [Salmonella enterica subsp. arizonae]EDN7231750.1 two component system sensor kinase [Salmonella enterica subsp. enterica]EHN2304321.1 two component system sensor kinase [Salmonella enterica]MBA3217790.1 two component system sensor kinase [Salmonella enterica]